ncbi:MAG: signal recognition particle protein [Bdellovibrionales bacterium]|nr:signal recognition particle protein [Bdellovibrionales bacterium]
MFDSLQKRLGTALKKVRGLSRVSEADIDAVLAEIRTGLLEADVHFRVVKDFLARVRERCLREDVIKSLSPEQQVLKVLSEELTQILGGRSRDLNLAVTPPAVILMCGLQGSGKTTSTVKLALHLKTQGKRPAVVSVDVNRPAAMDQLRALAEKQSVPVLSASPSEKPIDIARRALKEAGDVNADVLIVDTAGRLQVDEALMNELSALRELLQPTEVLLVCDAMMGQQAVEVAEGFDRRMSLTGAILTKLDGDSRGGAALSLVSVTGKPIKFIGTGERPTDFEPFHPDRISSRLLDMGDVMSLLEKAQKVISEEEALAATEKVRNPGELTLQDFRDQLAMLTRMGPISGLLKMLPGMGSLKDQLDKVDTEKELKRINAILDSMTPAERKQPEILTGSRRGRIARGSGTDVQEVNQLVKRFLDARKMMKQFGKFAQMAGGAGGGMPGMNPFKKGGNRGFGRKL